LVRLRILTVRTFFALGISETSPQKVAAAERDGDGDGDREGPGEEAVGEGDGNRECSGGADDTTGEAVADAEDETNAALAVDFDEWAKPYPSARTTVVAAAAVQIRSGRRVIR
jgi:hypothetical protein